jgi:ankyrin repeat protein
LIDAGAKVDVVDVDEQTPLHVAENKEVAEVLVDAGADVNAKVECELSPVRVAARGGKTEVAEVLVDAGVDVNMKDNDGQTPLHWAEKRGRKEIAKYLRTVIIQKEQEAAQEQQQPAEDELESLSAANGDFSEMLATQGQEHRQQKKVKFII